MKEANGVKYFIVFGGFFAPNREIRTCSNSMDCFMKAILPSRSRVTSSAMEIHMLSLLLHTATIVPYQCNNSQAQIENETVFLLRTVFHEICVYPSPFLPTSPLISRPQ